MDYLNLQKRFKRTEEAKDSLKLRLNEMKLRLKKRKEKFNLECSSFIQEELAFKKQLNDSGCLSEESSQHNNLNNNNKQHYQNLESLKNIQNLQKKIERKLKKQRKQRKVVLKPTTISSCLDETILSLVEFIGANNDFTSRPTSSSSRTSTPIFNEKVIRKTRSTHRSSQSKRNNNNNMVCCSAALQSPSVMMMPISSPSHFNMDNKYFNIIENNYYNYSINLNNYEQQNSNKPAFCSATPGDLAYAHLETPGEFQDFGDFKIWYL